MFPPKDPIASAPLLLVPPFLPLPATTVLRLDPVSHLPIHLKAKNAYWDPIWGWGRGAQVGPQQGWKTQQQHDQEEEVRKGGGYPNHAKDRVSTVFLSAFLFHLQPLLLSLSVPPSISNSLCSLSHHFFLGFFIFFLADALLTQVLLRLGCTVCLTLLQSQSRCSNQTQCVQR